jgi:hypothetical protein
VLESDYKKNYAASLDLLNQVMRLATRDPVFRKKITNRIEVAKIQLQAQQEMEAAQKQEALQSPPKANRKPEESK